MSNQIEIIVDEQSNLARIDKLLCLYIEQFTRSRIVSLIEDGSVTVNSMPVQKNHKVKTGDFIVVKIPEASEYQAVPQNIPIDVVYEDDDVIVVNKSKGMVVHPAHGNLDGTLVNALLYHCKGTLSGINGVMRPGIVHRIDKDTSGLVVVAKNDFTHSHLSEQFKDHSCEREYQAIVLGNFKDLSGTVDCPIGRHKTERKLMSCNTERGKPAVTHYEVIEQYDGFTHIKCKLETGRTHQIRVHLSSIGHPLLGDLVYGRKTDKYKLTFEGQCLHAKTLGFVHPKTNKFVIFDSELPEYFIDILNKLKASVI